MKLIQVILFLVVIFSIVGCAYDQLPTDESVNLNVSYKNDIQPIISAECYHCHSSIATDPERPGYAFFDDFNELKKFALKPSPVNPQYTVLQARLRQIEFPGMPFKKNPLPESQIRLIEMWIKAGAPNN